MKSITVAACVVVTLMVWSRHCLGREWIDSSGRHKTEADFLDIQREVVRLKKLNGEIISVPLELLSKADQDYVMGIAALPKPPSFNRVETQSDESPEVILVAELPTKVLGKTDAEKTAIRAIEASGGSVVSYSGVRERLVVSLTRSATDHDLLQIQEISGVHELHLNNCYRLTDHGLSAVKKVPGLQGLQLVGTDFTNAGFMHLAGIKSLVSLDLMETRISDQGLVHLANLERLEYLRLYDTDITDDGLVQLTKLSKLQRLDLSHTSITDAGLRHLIGLRELRSLELVKTGITDKGLSSLRPLRNLERIDVSNTSVSSAGAEKLRAAFPRAKVFTGARTPSSEYGIPSDKIVVNEDEQQAVNALTELGADVFCLQNGQTCCVQMNITRISDDDLLHLKSLSGLARLELTGSRVTNAGLAHLHGLKNLKQVFLYNTDVTEEGVDGLNKALPNARIFSPVSAPKDFAKVRRLQMEQSRLNGTWKVVACSNDGKPTERYVGIHYTFARGTVTIDHPERDPIEHGYTLAIEQTPKQLNIQWRNAFLQSVTTGIYEIDGDSMQWCWGRERPSGFVTKLGDGSTLFQLERVLDE